jgi:hypothetical protein
MGWNMCMLRGLSNQPTIILEAGRKSRALLKIQKVSENHTLSRMGFKAGLASLTSIMALYLKISA